MIIGISGKKGSGKDTVCKIIQYLITIDRVANTNELSPHTIKSYIESYSNFAADYNTNADYISGWKKKMFAEKLKQIVCILLDCTMEQLEDQEFKERELGEEWRSYYISYYKSKTNTSSTGRISPLVSSIKEAVDILDSIVKDINGPFFRAEGLSIVSQILTPRLLLQIIGTDFGRTIVHPNVWTNSSLVGYKKNIEKIFDIPKQSKTPDGGNYIIPESPSIPKEFWGDISINRKIMWYEYPKWIFTDVRFPNEAKAIKDRGGLLIRVNRSPTYITYDRVMAHYIGLMAIQHESETALDSYTEFDIVLDNSDTIEELIPKVKIFLQQQNLIA